MFKLNTLSVGQLDQPDKSDDKYIGFIGEKLFHPFNTIKLDKNKLKYLNEFTSDDVKNAIMDCTHFDVKHDGSCGALVYDEQNQKFIPYARYDIKKNSKGVFECKFKTNRWIPCGPEPTIDSENSIHWPHLRPLDEDPNSYKWFIEAYEIAKKYINNLNPSRKIYTLEYMGKKVNWKPCDPIKQNCVIVLHGLLRVDIPIEKRNYEGFRELFEELSNIEGIIAYTKTGPYKIRRDMYENMEWPSKSNNNNNNGNEIKSLSETVAFV